MPFRFSRPGGGINLMIAFAGSGLFYFLLGVVPRTFGSLLTTNILGLAPFLCRVS